MKAVAWIPLLLLAASLGAQEQPDAYYRYGNSVDARRIARTGAWLKAIGWLRSEELRRDPVSSEPRVRRTTYAHAAIDTIGELGVNLKRWVSRYDAGTPVNDSVATIRADRDFLRGELRLGLRAWVREFAAEIKQVGTRPLDLERKLQSCDRLIGDLIARQEKTIARMGGAPKFPDVPSDHWAADAVQALRDAGILVGYPPGKLRGD